MLKFVLLTALICGAAHAAVNPVYETLLDHYAFAKHRPSDINEHINTLYKYGRESDSVIECGVRTAISTWAFFRGLYDRGTSDGYDLSQLSLVGVDLKYDSQIGVIQELSATLGLPYTFYEGSDLDYPIKAPVDTVFIDTWHIYGQLKRELKKYAPYTKKWLILHDTTVDAMFGESIRSRSDIAKQAKESGFTPEEIAMGLWPAVEEFLAANPDFVLEHRYMNNNGLTVLRRVAEPMEDIKPYEVVDICLFNGEVEMLYLRLAELDPLVTKFYITESAVTFSGLDRDLVFPKIREDPRIKAYEHKIVYLPITEQISHIAHNWDRERFIREYAVPFVKYHHKDDYTFAISSDLDEIPNPDVVGPWLDANYRNVNGVIRINMDFHYYALRWRKRPVWVSAYLIPVKKIISLDAPRPAMPHTIPREMANRPGHISDAGWHMSYFLTTEEIQTKLKSFSPTDHNIPPYNTAEHIEWCVAEGLDLFDRPGEEMDPTPFDAPRPKNVHLLSPQYH